MQFSGGNSGMVILLSLEGRADFRQGEEFVPPGGEEGLHVPH